MVLSISQANISVFSQVGQVLVNLEQIWRVHRAVEEVLPEPASFFLQQVHQLVVQDFFDILERYEDFFGEEVFHLLELVEN